MATDRKYIDISTLDAISDKRRTEIRNSPDSLTISGNTYYVSNSGDDAADGRSPESASTAASGVSHFGRRYESA